MISSISRRGLLTTGAALLVAGHANAAAFPASRDSTLNMGLVRRAIAAMHERHAELAAMDRLAVVDFSLASRLPRMHLIDLEKSAVRSVLVAHGRGSDPDFTGWLSRFSNAPGSYASSEGSYVTGPAYVGEHGRSLRLVGMDKTNSNAEERAIVIHAASYVNEPQARNTGKIGRSEGCFAVAGASLDPVLSHLGTGRFLYAEKLGSGSPIAPASARTYIL